VVRVSKPLWRALSTLAIDEESSVQRLAIEAFDDLLVKHGWKLVPNPLLLRASRPVQPTT
jgi:hypothetical protein